MITVAAGGSAVHGGVQFECHDDGTACEITVSQTDQGITATSTGGSTTSTAAPEASSPRQIPTTGNPTRPTISRLNLDVSALRTAIGNASTTHDTVFGTNIPGLPSTITLSDPKKFNAIIEAGVLPGESRKTAFYRVKLI